MEKMIKGTKASLKPTIEDNNPNNNCDRSENQKIENKILFVRPLHSSLLYKINPQTILINGSTSNMLALSFYYFFTRYSEVIAHLKLIKKYMKLDKVMYLEPC